MNEEYPISYVIADMKNLFEEHKKSVHSLILDEEKPYSPYMPTYFMYSFFFFNTLYNIDWEKSIETENETMSEIRNEEKKIKALIDFCFSDEKYSSENVKNICKVIQDNDYKLIMSCLEAIQLDKHKKG